ncbi:MAG: Zn-dependent alcohol dehydrogenase [Pseudomonadota bacterium]
MKAAVLRQTGQALEIEDVAIDLPKAHEVLIRTVASGVCHSDLHIQQGLNGYPLPTILGHEGAGVVEKVGSDVRSLKPGDHVVTCISAYCGHCNYCLSGHMALCFSPETRRTKGEAPRLLGSGPNPRMHQFFNVSAFAEQMLVHEHACVRIRPDMPLDRAAIIGCGVLTGVGAVTRSAKVRPGESVAVLGCGGVGLAAINGARIAGAGRIVAIDRLPEKLELAKHFGATDTVLAGDDVEEQVLELSNGGVDHSFEAVGMKATAELAYRLVRRGGACTVIGLLPDGAKIEVDAAGLNMEKTLQGSSMGSNLFPIDIPQLVDFYMQGRLDLDRLISRRITLDQVNDAFEELKGGHIARSVIQF